MFSAKSGKERNIIFIRHMKYHVSSLAVIFLFTCEHYVDIIHGSKIFIILNISCHIMFLFSVSFLFTYAIDGCET